MLFRSKVYANDFDFMELGKLAIDYSDGIVEASETVNSENNQSYLLVFLLDQTNNNAVTADGFKAHS